MRPGKSLHNRTAFTVKSFIVAYPTPSLDECAVTNARFASLPRLPVVRMPLDDARAASQTARSSRALHGAGPQERRLPSAARRRALRFSFVPLNAPLRLRSTCPARRPQTEARVYRRGGRDTRRDSACCSNNSRVRPTSAASADSLGNTVWYSRTSILFPNPSIA